MDDLDYIIFSSVSAEDEALLRAAQGEDHTFSDSYRRKMELLYRNGRKAKRPLRWKKRLIATIVAAALLIGSVTAGAFWKEISAFFQSLYVQYADLRTVQKPASLLALESEELNSWSDFWFPDYLPDGYSFSRAKENPSVKAIAFISSSGDYLDFEQMPCVAVVGNDTEGTPVDGITVGDFETFAFEKEMDGATTRILIWSDESSSFRLTGAVSFDELIKVAECIIYIEREGQ